MVKVFCNKHGSNISCLSWLDIPEHRKARISDEDHPGLYGLGRDKAGFACLRANKGHIAQLWVCHKIRLKVCEALHPCKHLMLLLPVCAGVWHNHKGENLCIVQNCGDPPSWLWSSMPEGYSIAATLWSLCISL